MKGGNWGRRRLTGLIVGVALLVLAIAASLLVGAESLSPSAVFNGLLHDAPTQAHGILWDGRIPRTLLGLLAGVGLGLAGALIQGLTRNPLADPGVLGVNAGAAFFIVIAVGFLGIGSMTGYIWFAFFGAMVTSVLVYVVGTGGRRAVNPLRLTLSGVAVGAVLTGIANGIALAKPAAFDYLRAWSIGSLDVQSMDPVRTMLPFVVVGVVCALVAAPGLNAVSLGDDVAASLGVNLNLARAASVVAITLLAGSATAAAGAIGFVGLMIPHVARWISGPDQRWIAGFTMLYAPVLLLAADVVGRVITSGEMQVGVVTAFVGAPVLIGLARGRRVRAL